MTAALQWIAEYQGGNLLKDPYIEADEAIQDAAYQYAARGGHGFSRSPEQRRAIEKWAVQKAKYHFIKKGYKVQEKGKPYDLLCTKKGKSPLYVEVKGTRSLGEKIIVTRNEVEFARCNRERMLLFVVHSMALNSKKGGKSPKVSGGIVVIRQPWAISARALRPLAYALTIS
jgi:hypothetical protein